MNHWVEVCHFDDIERSDVIRFDYDGRTFGICRTEGDGFYATDGLCTHGNVHLADGMVMGNIIECPKHNGCFDIITEQAKGAPVCVDLKTYPARIDTGRVLIDIP